MYISALQQCQEWLQPQRSLQVGDLVLVTNETTSPGHWPLGRVTATFPGTDSHVRAVTVKTATSLLDRPSVYNPNFKTPTYKKIHLFLIIALKKHDFFQNQKNRCWNFFGGTTIIDRKRLRK